MKYTAKRIFVVLALLCSGAAYADMQVFGESTDLSEDVACFNDSQKEIEWTYCISKTLGSTNQDLLFEFHGIGESEHGWIDKGRNRNIREAWRDLNLQAPTVISISFGRVWLLAEKNSAENSGLYEVFRDAVYPRIMQKLGANVGHHYLLGASMGGFNGSQIYLKLPQFFDHVALICPIMAEVSPFSTDDEIQKYIDDTGASPLRVKLMIHVAKDYFGNQQDFDNGNVLKIGQQALGPSSPKLYLSVSHEDPYGIYAAVEKFKTLAESRGAPTKFVDTHGGHCTINAADLAKFLASP